MAEQAALAANVSQLSRSLGLVTEMYQFTMNYQETEMFQLTNMPKLRLGAVSWSVPSSNLPGDRNVYGTAGLFPECHFDTFPCDEICRFISEFQPSKNFKEFLLLKFVFQFVTTNNSWPKSKKIFSARKSAEFIPEIQPSKMSLNFFQLIISFLSLNRIIRD